MRISILGFILVWVTAACAEFQWNRKKSDIAPGRYIVEFQHRVEMSPYQFSNEEDPELTTQSIFFREVRALGIDVNPLRNFTSGLFQGASFDIANYDASTLEELRARDNVKNVWPARYVKLFDYDSKPATAPIWSPHQFTGVQELHDRGFTGKGITVGIVDTGVNYHHPALGGGIGPGYKVAGGYNFVGDGSMIDELHPNKNPNDCWGHGTHVAGIVAGSSQNLVGVAPNATIMAYKVFSCAGNPTDDLLVAAFEKAFFDGVDIITCSVGSAGTGFLTDPTSMLASRLAELGVFISIAAGNEGDTGPFYPSSPASGELVASVASVEASTIVKYNASANTTIGNSTSLQYITTAGFAPELTGTFDLLVFDKCEKLSGLSKSTNNHTAILFPAELTCSGFSFYNQVKELGYPVVFNYLTNNQAQLWYNQPSLDVGFKISIFGTTTYEFGQWALGHSSQNISITIGGVASRAASAYKGAGFINVFSTWGPTYEGRFYPSISAPGGNIFSTWLNNRYSIISGTSMATPYIAGVAALYFESIGGRPQGLRGGTDLRKKLITTADFLPLYTRGVQDSPSDFAPVVQQGGGLVNAVKLIDSKTVVDTDPAVSLKGQSHIRTPFEVTITNNNALSQTYELLHQPTVTINTRTKSNSSVSFFPPYTHEYLIPQFHNGKKFEIPAKSSLTTIVSFALPPRVDFGVSPVFQGKIVFKSEKESVGIPYIGK